MGIKARIVRRLKDEAFDPGLLGIFVNPFYIIRKGLRDGVRRMAPRVGGKVLDFGCGSKPYAAMFAHAESYVGVDIAVSGHDHVESNIDVFYDGKTLPFDDAAFDSAVAFEVFEHLFNLTAILAELHRVVRPSGALFFTIPFAWDEHEVPYDFARYTSFGIAAILERQGFEIVELHKTTNYVQAVCQLFLAYLYQHALPKQRYLKRVVQLIVIPPLLVFSLILNRLLPKSDAYYSNLAILCRRVDVPAGSAV